MPIFFECEYATKETMYQKFARMIVAINLKDKILQLGDLANIYLQFHPKH